LFETFSGHDPDWCPFIIQYERQFAVPGPHRVVIRNEEDKGFFFDALVYEILFIFTWELNETDMIFSMLQLRSADAS